MVKLIVLYGPPSDPEAFDKHYFDIHVPLAEKIPGVRHFSLSRPSTLDGSPSPYHLIAELTFDSAEAMGEAMGTEAGKAAAADVATFATGGATMLLADVVAGD
jgi:uncharacterized protein (TIGR02118 family)